MKDGEVALAVVSLLGLLGGNPHVALAAGALLALALVAPPPLLAWIEAHSIHTGILFMTLGLLVPFATGKMGLSHVAQTLFSPAGLLAVGVGTLASCLGVFGLGLLAAKPQVMVGLIIGSILGVSFLGGIPTGPLVAAGFAALLFRILQINR